MYIYIVYIYLYVSIYFHVISLCVCLKEVIILQPAFLIAASYTKGAYSTDISDTNEHFDYF